MYRNEAKIREIECMLKKFSEAFRVSDKKIQQRRPEKIFEKNFSEVFSSCNAVSY